MCIYHGVVKSTKPVGMTLTLGVQKDVEVVMFSLECGYIACYDTGTRRQRTLRR